MALDIKPGSVVSILLLAGVGYAAYKFWKGDWKLPNLGDLFNLGDPGSIPNIILDIATPGIESMPPITELHEIGTTQRGVVYDYDQNRIIGLPKYEELEFPGVGAPGAPEPPGPGIPPGGGPLAPEPPEKIITAVQRPDFKPPKIFEPSPEFQKIVPTEKQMKRTAESISVEKPISYVAPKIKEAIVQEAFGGTKLGSIIVGGFR